MRRGRCSLTIEPSRAEPSRAEPSRAEPSRAEPSRAEPSRAEPSRAEPSRAEPSRAEPSRAEPSRAEPSRAEPSRAEPSRAEPSRAEPSRAEPSRAEPSRAVSSRAEPSRAEPSRSCVRTAAGFLRHLPLRAADAMGGDGHARERAARAAPGGPAHALSRGLRLRAGPDSLSPSPGPAAGSASRIAGAWRAACVALAVCLALLPGAAPAAAQDGGSRLLTGLTAAAGPERRHPGLDGGREPGAGHRRLHLRLPHARASEDRASRGPCRASPGAAPPLRARARWPGCRNTATTSSSWSRSTGRAVPAAPGRCARSGRASR